MIFICENCSSEFKRSHKSKFCSHRCSAVVNNHIRGKNRNHPKPCPICGSLHQKPKFCSRKCGWEAKKRPLTPEKIEKKRIRNLVGVRKYQAKRLNQTPPDADFEVIKQFYTNCPDGYEVDHIIPISKGGLHHQDNLQYLLMSDNRRKSNKLDWVSNTPMAERFRRQTLNLD